MSDPNTPLPPGSVNVEDDGPTTPPPPTAPVAAAPEPAAPVAEPEPSDPEKAGLLAALRAEREKAKTLAEKAARADQLEAYVHQHRPTLEFLEANPDVLKRPAAPATPPPTPDADPDAVEAARLMDFYKADGSPDVERGARYLALQDRRAQRVAQQTVQPLQHETAQERSAKNFQMALQVKDAAGHAPSAESLRAAWQTMPVEDSANPQVAAVLAALALGMDRMRPPAPVAPPQEPLVSEPPGGAPRPTTTLTPMHQRIAANRGQTATQFAELMKGFKPGQPTILESD